MLGFGNKFMDNCNSLKNALKKQNIETLRKYDSAVALCDINTYAKCRKFYLKHVEALIESATEKELVEKLAYLNASSDLVSSFLHSAAFAVVLLIVPDNLFTVLMYREATAIWEVVYAGLVLFMVFGVELFLVNSMIKNKYNSDYYLVKNDEIKLISNKLGIEIA